MHNLAPVVLFVYNRAEHTKKTIESLKKNKLAKETKLIIYADGAKNERDFLKVQMVRDYINTISGFGEVEFVLSGKNRGLSESIIVGVTEVVNKYGKVIVMEDDIVTAPYFLKYMNDSLTRYAEEKSVFSITGHSFFDKGCKKIERTYFIKKGTCWTWATWKDRWQLFDRDAKGWEILKRDSSMRSKFDLDGASKYTQMMIAQMELGTVDSWMIRWYWTVFINQGLTLFSNKPLCENIGLDGSGVHCGEDLDKSQVELFMDAIDYFPSEIEENKLVRKKVVQYLKRKQFVKKWKSYGRYFLNPRKLLKRIKVVKQKTKLRKSDLKK